MASHVPWVDGFTPPGPAERLAAVGPFPSDHARAARLAHNHPPTDSTGWQRPSLASGSETAADAFEQVNEERWYREPSPSASTTKPAKKRRKAPLLWPPLPPPRDENDWLAQVCEEGQSFEGEWREV